jgi:hypothetical protein
MWNKRAIDILRYLNEIIAYTYTSFILEYRIVFDVAGSRCSVANIATRLRTEYSRN